MLWKFYECKLWIIKHIWTPYLILKAWKANPVASLFARFRYFQKGCNKRLMIPKKSLPEISITIEISTNSYSHGIIEYKIFCSVLCILHVNLGQTLVKLFLLVFPILHTYQWILTIKMWCIRTLEIIHQSILDWYSDKTSSSESES